MTLSYVQQLSSLSTPPHRSATIDRRSQQEIRSAMKWHGTLQQIAQRQDISSVPPVNLFSHPSARPGQALLAAPPPVAVRPSIPVRASGLSNITQEQPLGSSMATVPVFPLIRHDTHGNTQDTEIPLPSPVHNSTNPPVQNVDLTRSPRSNEIPALELANRLLRTQSISSQKLHMQQVQQQEQRMKNRFDEQCRSGQYSPLTPITEQVSVQPLPVYPSSPQPRISAVQQRWLRSVQSAPSSPS